MPYSQFLPQSINRKNTRKQQHKLNIHFMDFTQRSIFRMITVNDNQKSLIQMKTTCVDQRHYSTSALLEQVIFFISLHLQSNSAPTFCRMLGGLRGQELAICNNYIYIQSTDSNKETTTTHNVSIFLQRFW